MNIFYFDECPVVSAEAQPDKMLVKMPLETAQMLCTAHRVLDGDEYADSVGLYKEAYKNHPCTIWARESRGNYEWLYIHFLALAMEYTYRYGKEHLSYTKLHEPLEKHPDNIHRGDMTPLAQAMPDEYKNDNPVVAYRDYVIHEKHYAKWEKNREKPKWWTR
jgi:two-component SAPR family response regulator